MCFLVIGGLQKQSFRSSRWASSLNSGRVFRIKDLWSCWLKGKTKRVRSISLVASVASKCHQHHLTLIRIKTSQSLPLTKTSSLYTSRVRAFSSLSPITISFWNSSQTTSQTELFPWAVTSCKSLWATTSDSLLAKRMLWTRSSCNQCLIINLVLKG